MGPIDLSDISVVCKNKDCGLIEWWLIHSNACNYWRVCSRMSNFLTEYLVLDSITFLIISFN